MKNNKELFKLVVVLSIALLFLSPVISFVFHSSFSELISGIVGFSMQIAFGLAGTFILFGVLHIFWKYLIKPCIELLETHQEQKRQRYIQKQKEIEKSYHNIGVPSPDELKDILRKM